MTEGISIFGELTLLVICETYDTVRLGTIANELIGIHYSANNDRIKTESQFLLQHLIENPHLDQNDLIQIVCVNAFLAAHAVKAWPKNQEIVETMWRCHIDQIVNQSGIANAVPLRGMVKSKVMTEEIFSGLINRLSLNPDNGPHLLAIVRDHEPGKMIEDQVLDVEWLPLRLRRKIEDEIAAR